MYIVAFSWWAITCFYEIWGGPTIVQYMGVRRKFSRGGATLTYCLSFSGCWRCDANGRSKLALAFLHHKENYPWYKNSPKNCASLVVIARCITIIYTMLINLFSIVGRIYVYFYELRPPQIVSTSLFDCPSTEHAHTVEQGSQTRRSHVVPEGILCDPRCVLGTFI